MIKGHIFMLEDKMWKNIVKFLSIIESPYIQYNIECVTSALRTSFLQLVILSIYHLNN